MRRLTAKKYTLILLALFLLSASLGFAENETPDKNVFLSFKNAKSNEYIESGIVFVDLNKTLIAQYLPKGEELGIRLEKGVYPARFMVDLYDTEGRDYYGTYTLDVSNNTLHQTIYLNPAASLGGVVKDRFDNLVSNAKLKFECSGTAFETPENTGDFGSFFAEYLPEGKCRVYAAKGDFAGYKEVFLEQGALENIEIILEMKVKKEAGWGFFVFPAIILVVIVFLALAVYYFSKGGSKRKSEQKLDKEKKAEKTKAKGSKEYPSDLGKRAKDIIATLSKREKEIVSFISENMGKTTQSKIYHGTGIPKVSLSRCVKFLEQKNVIEVRKAGKVNNIRFTKWFLGEENAEQ